MMRQIIEIYAIYSHPLLNLCQRFSKCWRTYSLARIFRGSHTGSNIKCVAARDLNVFRKELTSPSWRSCQTRRCSTKLR